MPYKRKYFLQVADAVTTLMYAGLITAGLLSVMSFLKYQFASQMKLITLLIFVLLVHKARKMLGEYIDSKY